MSDYIEFHKGERSIQEKYNIALNPDVDFEKGHTLLLSGSVKLLFDQETEKDHQATTGTGRYWTFKPEQWIFTENHHEAKWELIDFSPFNPEKI